MKGKAFGFEILLGSSIRQDIIWDALSRHAPPMWRRSNLDNHFKLQVDGSGDVIAGTVLRLRGEKEDTVTQTRTLATRVRTVEDGHQLSAATHFIFCRQTLRGLYFAYQGALPFGDFRAWVRATCGSFVHSALREARQKAKDGSGKADPAKVKAVSQGFDIDCVPYLRKDRLDELLKAWKSVNELEYVVSSSVKERHRDSPLYPNTTRVLQTLKLSLDATEGGKRAGGLSGLVRRIFSHLKFLHDNSQIDPDIPPRVSGVDENDDRKTINLDEVLDDFFSDQVGYLNIGNWTAHDPLQCPIVRRMLTAVAENGSTFTIPSR